MNYQLKEQHMPHFTRRTRETNTQHNKAVSRPYEKRGRAAGPLAFFITLFIVAIGAIQLISTMHSYALSVAELNGLRKQEAELIRQKDDLNKQIERWKDPVFVASRAREELGFIFPGEQPVRVLHADQLPGVNTAKSQTTSTNQENRITLPWYNEMLYSIRKADTPPVRKTMTPPASSPQKPAPKQATPGR